MKKLQYRIILIVATFVLGGGLYFLFKGKTEKQTTAQLNEDRRASEKSAKLELPPRTPAEHPHEAKETALETSTAPKKGHASKDTISPGTRQKLLGAKRTACSDVYETVIELNNNPTLVDTFNIDDQTSQKCTAELRKMVPKFDTYVTELEKCNSNKEKLDAKGKNECLRVASILRLSFVENEYRGKDPSDLPSPVLRSMIAYRALQMEHFTENEADLDYFYRLAAEEQRLSPENDLGSMRSLLVGYLMKKNPEKYDNDFEQTVIDIEQSNPESALSSRIQRYKSELSNPDLISEIDLFLSRNPSNSYALYAKAAILAQKGDWSGADSLMTKAISLASDKDFFEKERAKFARKEAGIVVRQSFTISL